MKLFFGFLLPFLFSISSFADFFPTACRLTIGGRCFTDAEVTRFESGTLTAGGGFIATNHVATSTRFSPLKIGTTAYQAGASVHANCVALKISSDGAATVGAQLTYSDDVAIFDDTTMTNIVYQTGQASSPVISLPATGWNSGEIFFGPTGGFTVLSNKYLSFQASGAVVTLTAYCFVEAN